MLQVFCLGELHVCACIHLDTYDCCVVGELQNATHAVQTDSIDIDDVEIEFDPDIYLSSFESDVPQTPLPQELDFEVELSPIPQVVDVDTDSDAYHREHIS